MVYFPPPNPAFAKMTLASHNYLLLRITNFNVLITVLHKKLVAFPLTYLRPCFDKVWHERLLLKLKTFGIRGQLLILVKDFLSDRLQRVVLNGQSSDWKSILAGLPKDLSLDRYFFSSS